MNSKEIEYRNFQEYVYRSISKCLSKDETIEFNQFFDFFLPSGVRNLNWEEGTYIEVKYKLITYSLDRLRLTYDRIKAKKLIVVYLEDDLGVFSKDRRKQLNDPLKGRNIQFISYADLYRKASSLKNDLGKEGTIDDLFRTEREKNVFDRAKEALKKDKVSLFLGAGVSIPVGSVSWVNLLNNLLNNRNLTIDINSPKRNVSELEKGRYVKDDYLKKAKNRADDFYKDIRDIIYGGVTRKKGDIIEVIASLISKYDLESVITYNYDNLIEQEINDHPRKYKMQCHPVYDKSGPIFDNSRYIYHVHGYISENNIRSDEIILGEKEYHKVYQDSYNWSNVEQLHALNRSTCFFIGLSMTDPNLRRLLDISFDGSDKDPVHYAFLCRVDHDIAVTEKVMNDFGVNCIWYDNYNDLPKLLSRMI